MKTRNLIVAALVATLSVGPAWAGPGGYHDDGRDLPRHHDRWDRGSDSDFTDRARVIDVDPVYETVRIPVSRRECRPQTVWHEQRDGRDVDAGSGLIAGTLIGGVIGNQVGKGKGRKAATIIGAVLGAAVGHDMASGSSGQGYRYATHEERCDVVRHHREETRIAGYHVTYRYRGRTFTRFMDHDPGRWVEVDVRVSDAH
ncbi:glycine zipper 2TM domain-containing protein [Endothiovibrio diazotrophicus]